MADRRITRAADSLEISVICNPHAVIYGECETKHLIISQELIIWTAWISASFPSAVSDPFFYKWLRRGIVCAPGGGRGWAPGGGGGGGHLGGGGGGGCWMIGLLNAMQICTLL